MKSPLEKIEEAGKEIERKITCRRRHRRAHTSGKRKNGGSVHGRQNGKERSSLVYSRPGDLISRPCCIVTIVPVCFNRVEACPVRRRVCDASLASARLECPEGHGGGSNRRSSGTGDEKEPASLCPLMTGSTVEDHYMRCCNAEWDKESSRLQSCFKERQI